MFLGKYVGTSILPSIRHAPVWKSPTDWVKIHALNKLAIPATHIIWIIWPRTKVVPPPLILAVISPRTIIETMTKNDPMN